MIFIIFLVELDEYLGALITTDHFVKLKSIQFEIAEYKIKKEKTFTFHFIHCINEKKIQIICIILDDACESLFLKRIIR